MPLLAPILFALVIAPALKAAPGGLHTGIDYTAFVAVGTIGLLVPLSCIFAGLSVIVDRDSGAQRELLAAPVPRALLVLGNLSVVLALAALQVVVLIALAALRGADFHITRGGPRLVRRRRRSCSSCSCTASPRRSRRASHKQEEYIGAPRPSPILPCFFAGALFPIGAMPGALTAFAKVLPLTHALALMRYGLVDPHAARGLHDIWGMGNDHDEAWLSLAVVALFAAAFVTLAVRSFTRSAVR